ncbi:MAG TPA: D-alanine--D-alanine ligase, partial [Alphaproteobacteria bacterium]
MKRVAVFIGGRSPEHDVSVVSGLQAFQAMDRSQYEPFLVYVTLGGAWYVGEALEQRSTYIPGPEMLRNLTEVTLDMAVDTMGKGRLIPKKSGFFSKVQPISFDIAFLSFHGLFGEDGGFQGLFDVAGIAYTGMRTMGTSVLMDKAATKRIMTGTGVPMLPYVIIDRPKTGMPNAVAIQEKLGKINLPVIVKPAHLGSSIGVARAATVEEIVASLPAIFKLDHQAIVEPFVENLVEYNVAVSACMGELRTS